MAIFSEEFITKVNSNRQHIAYNFRKIFSDVITPMGLHAIILVSLILGVRIMTTFGVVGLNAWWEQYSVLNPYLQIEDTAMYWVFIIADRLLFLATVLEFCYVGILLIVWGMENSEKEEKKHNSQTKTPLCPNCKNNMDIIRKGTNKGVERFFCKSCGKYFQKKRCNHGKDETEKVT